MKICTICKGEKPIEEFHKNAKSKDGRYPQCILCFREKSRGRMRIKRGSKEKKVFPPSDFTQYIFPESITIY